MKIKCSFNIFLYLCVCIPALWQQFNLVISFFCFHFLLKYSLHMILCYFQVYNIVILHLYTLQYDHHNKSSTYLPLYKVIMNYWLYSLCCLLHPCGLFYHWKYISLILLFHSFLPPSSCLAIINLFSFSLLIFNPTSFFSFNYAFISCKSAWRYFYSWLLY